MVDRDEAEAAQLATREELYEVRARIRDLVGWGPSEALDAARERLRFLSGELQRLDVVCTRLSTEEDGPSAVQQHERDAMIARRALRQVNPDRPRTWTDDLADEAKRGDVRGGWKLGRR